MLRSSPNCNVLLPIEPFTVEELKFWLEIIAEHVLFIKSGIPCGESEILRELENFYKELTSFRARAERKLTDKKLAELVADAYCTVIELNKFQRHLLQLLLHCKLSGGNFPLFIDHIIRETEYVIALFNKMKAGKFLSATKVQEEAFWVRIMSDHTKFIRQKLDPSERNLITTIEEFSKEFDDLFLQGNDFVSMLTGVPSVPSFTRYTQDVRMATIRLRNFKKAAYVMITECKLLGIIPAIVADHVRREADHFLLLIAMMDKGLVKEIDCTESMIEDDEIEDTEEPEELDCLETDSCNPCDAETEMHLEEESTDEECVEMKQAPKYKWGVKWPRPLGQ